MDSDRKIIQANGLLTLSDIRNACEFRYGNNGELIEVCQISEELRQGIDILQKFPKIASIYGSARFYDDNEDYKAVEELAYTLSKELGLSILTGGGGGIMEAGNRGANRAGGVSIGATIRIPKEQLTNRYVTDIIPFHYFFTRKIALRYSTQISIYCPGGFGTLDELFEVLTLIQTRKMHKIPIVLFGSKFWNPLDKFIKENLLDTYKTISDEDRSLYIITDDVDTVVEIARKAKDKIPLVVEELRIQ